MLWKTVIVFMQLTIIYAELPVTKCKVSDGACMKEAAQKAAPLLADGIPELKIEPLDVMKIDNVKVDLAGLKMVMKDADMKGLKKTVIDKVSIDMNKKILLLIYHADILLKGKYTASGRLLILPISGNGDLEMKLKYAEVQLTMPFEVIKGADGKDVLNLKSYTFTYDVKDNAHYRLTNLFNGNKVLSDSMLKFMNENWKVLSQEFGKPMFEKPIHKVFKAVKTYLRTVPLENIIEN